MIYIPRIKISAITPTSTAFRTAINSMFMIEPLNKAILECMHEEPRDSGDCDMIILQIVGQFLSKIIVHDIQQNVLISDFIKMYTTCHKYPRGRELISKDINVDNIARNIEIVLSMMNHPHIDKTILVRRRNQETGAIYREYYKELQSINDMKTAGGKITRIGEVFIVVLPISHNMNPIRFVLTCGLTIYVPSVIYEAGDKKIVAYIATERVI